MSREVIQLGKKSIREIRGFQARQREIQREYLDPLQEEFREFVSEVEKEYEVEVGKTHFLNMDEGKLYLIPPTPAPVERPKVMASPCVAEDEKVIPFPIQDSSEIEAEIKED